MSKKPAVKKSEAPAVVDYGAFDQEESMMIDPNDIILPKILVMQGLSQLVADGERVMGDFVESLDGKKLGDKDNPLLFTPFYITNTWVLFEKEGDNWKYAGQMERNAKNKDLPWNEIVEGKETRRDKCINVYCVRPEEIASGEEFLPYLISFRRTSFKAGSKIVTAQTRARMYKKPLVSSTFKLTARKEKNDQGTYYVLDVAKERNTTEKELEQIAPWYKLITSTSISVDQSDLEEDAARQSSPDVSSDGDIRDDVGPV